MVEVETTHLDPILQDTSLNVKETDRDPGVNMSGDLDEREAQASPPKEQPKPSVSPTTPVSAVDFKYYPCITHGLEIIKCRRTSSAD